jgi:hypothetical protein
MQQLGLSAARNNAEFVCNSLLFFQVELISGELLQLFATQVCLSSVQKDRLQVKPRHNIWLDLLFGLTEPGCNLTAHRFALQKRLVDAFSHLSVLSVAPRFLAIDEQLVFLKAPALVGRRAPRALDGLLQVFQVYLLQNGLKVVVKLLAKSGSEHLLDALVKDFLDAESPPFQYVQEVHELVFALHIGSQERLVLLYLGLQLTDLQRLRL